MSHPICLGDATSSGGAVVSRKLVDFTDAAFSLIFKLDDIQGTKMNSTQSRTPGQRILSVLIVVGVWLPIIGLMLHLAAPQQKSLAGAMGAAAVFFLLAKIEIVAIILLIGYAFWVRPWKLAGGVYAAFQINIFGAGAATLLFANFIFGWCRFQG
jgi:hypothetical protein